MMKKTMIVLLAGTALFTACKKTDTTATTTAQKVLGKWTYVSDVFTYYNQGTSKTTTTLGNTSDYADFRVNGKVYLQFKNQLDTSDYKIINDNQISIDGDTSLIKTLTATSFITYYKLFTVRDSSETTETFKK